MSEPIPQPLVEAFAHAVALTDPDWHGENDPDRPDLSLDRRPAKPSEVCRFTMVFDDRMPDPIYDALCARGYFSKDHSFMAGARFLLGIIEQRKAEYLSRSEK